MKRNLYKIFSLVLTCLLICTSLYVPAIADTPQRIELGSPAETVKVGDTVDIPIVISNPNNLNGLQLKLTWDITELSATEGCFTRAENTKDLFKALYSVNDKNVAKGSFLVSGSAESDTLFKDDTTPYKIGTIRFTVLAGAAGKKVTVSVDPKKTKGNVGTTSLIFAAPVNAEIEVESAATTKYTVTFKNEDAVVKSFEVEDGKTIGAEMPADPTKEGYTFDGWYDGETKITAETVVKGNITATAKFTAKTVDVPQRIELGSPAETVKVGDTVDIPIVISNPNNLNGLQLKLTWDITELSATEGCFTRAENTKDLFKALYSVNDKNVAKGSFLVSGSAESDTLFKDDTTPYKIGTIRFTVLAGAAGKKVTVSVDPKKTKGNVGTTSLIFAAPVNAEIEVESAAVTQYTVKFNDGTTDVKTVQIDENTAIGAENMPADPTKEGYTFDGWFDGETKITAETVVKGNITATAKFTLIPPTQYAVTFKDGETTVDTVMVNKGETVTAEKMPKAPEKTGYTFKGWFIGEDEFTGDTVVNDNITVTAVYEINKYTVTFKDGENELGKADVDYNTAIGAANMPADPTKEGYTFDGWYDGETKITAETVVTGNITVTAKFDVNSYQVTFDIDGTTEKVVTINYGDKIGDEMPADPVKEGYVFKGWFNGEEEITKDTEVKGIFTATAKFEEKVPENFTVTFVSDGKTVYMADILEGTTIGDANIPNDRVKDGYTFKGWFNGDDEVKADTTVTGNITVEAKFEVTPAEEIFSLGDADGSGEINGADIVLFRQKLLRRPVMVFDSSKDLYKDGEFDGNDVIRLAQYYAGLLDDSNIQITPAP